MEYVEIISKIPLHTVFCVQTQKHKQHKINVVQIKKNNNKKSLQNYVQCFFCLFRPFVQEQGVMELMASFTAVCGVLNVYFF